MRCGFHNLGFLCVVVGTIFGIQSTGQSQSSGSADTTSHTIQLVPAEQNVKLEVIDWGGTGRPLIFLAGLGNNAHVYDTFAPKFNTAHHVYGITRRGYGASSAPEPNCRNFSADRLGDDVLAVMESLKINKPVLIGHSLAGEELSSIGTRHPDKIAALVYLDAGYAYAYYDAKSVYGDPIMDFAIGRSELEQLSSPLSSRERKAFVKDLLTTTLPRIEKDLQAAQQHLQTVPDTAPAPADTPEVKYGFAVQRGVQKFTGVKSPTLAIFAVPHNLGSQPGLDTAARASAAAEELARTSAQVNAFEIGNPHARIIRLPNADHFIFRSNEGEVFRSINDFITTLPRS